MLFSAINAVCPNGHTAVTNTQYTYKYKYKYTNAQYSIDSNLVVHIITTVFYIMQLKKYKTILSRSIITILVITCMQGM
jgi:hypothetical protein